MVLQLKIHTNESPEFDGLYKLFVAELMQKWLYAGGLIVRYDLHKPYGHVNHVIFLVPKWYWHLATAVRNKISANRNPLPKCQYFCDASEVS